MTINQTRIDEIYEQLNAYMIELGDPSAFGPSYYIDKIAKCRNYLNSVSLVGAEFSREKQVTSSELRKQEALYELESARLLSTDESVRRMSAIKDRESMVAHILRDRKARIDQLRDQLLSIDAVYKYITHRSRELHSTMDAIKNQRRFMQIEVQTGAFYGDERRPDHESVGVGPAGITLDFDEDEIKKAIDEAAGEGAAAVTEEEVSSPKDDPPKDAPVVQESSLHSIARQGEVVTLLGAEEPTPVKEAPKPSPEPAKDVVLDDDFALRLFLGGGAEEPPKPPLVSPTVEPSPSVSQAEIEDFSSLLDSI